MIAAEGVTGLVADDPQADTPARPRLLRRISGIRGCATAVFLEINDASVADVADDEVYDLVITVASAQVAIEDIAGRVESLRPTSR